MWVPYELGRPLGAPNDKTRQTSVLRALIALFEAPSGPVLEDFPDDGKTAAAPEDLSGMACPITFKRGADDTSLAAEVRGEIAQLQPWYDLARERRGRTTFGAAGLEIEDLVELLIAWADGTPPTSPAASLAPENQLKLAVEDLKAFYLEAANAQPTPGASPLSSAELGDWLWRETAGGRLLVAVHRACIASAHPAWRVVGANFIVPRSQWTRLGIDASAWLDEKK
ncbi:MAG: hypothetical protein ACKVP7_08745 [Hyphomicrobiaceae bacterium]